MTRTNDLARVIDLACLTEDRDGAEQRALLALALRADLDRGAFLHSNDDLCPPTLVAHVEATYEPSIGRGVSLTAAQRQQYDRLLLRWVPCRACGWPNGIHYGNDHVGNCPREDDAFLPKLVEWRAAHVEAVAR